MADGSGKNGKPTSKKKAKKKAKPIQDRTGLAEVWKQKLWTI